MEHRKKGPQDADSRGDLGSPEYRTSIAQASLEQLKFLAFSGISLHFLYFLAFLHFLGAVGLGGWGLGDEGAWSTENRAPPPGRGF